MKKQLILLSSFLTILMLLSTIGGSISTQNSGLNHDFSENYFAIEIDLNADLDNFKNHQFNNVDVIRDLENNSFVGTDTNPDLDQQFFLSYVNASGIETAYLALEKIEFDLKFNPPFGSPISIGNVNGTAPFQSIVQHFQSYGNDIFITNYFNGFVAYSTTPNDEVLDENDTSYLGYTLVESHLLDLLQNALDTNNINKTLGSYGFEPIFSAGDTTGNGTEFGIKYTNMLVAWQNLAAGFSGNVSLPGSVSDSLIPGSQMVVTGGNLVAMSLFDSIEFKYEVSLETNATHTIANIVTTYNLGPVSLLIVRESQETYNDILNNVSSVTSANSLHMPTQTLEIPVGNIGIIQITIPELSIYVDAAARARIDAHAVSDVGATGFGISVVSSTNVIVVQHEVLIPNTVDDGQNITIPLYVGSNKIFDTSFEGKSTYSKDMTIDGGSLLTGLPVYVDVVSKDHVQVQDIFKDYFNLQQYMTTSFARFMGSKVSPLIAAELQNKPDYLDVDIDHSAYLTFVQMGQWSGYPLTQDPTFSAVSTVSTTGGEDTETGGGTGGGEGPTGIVPGFEVVAVIAAIPVAYFILKKKRQK